MAHLFGNALRSLGGLASLSVLLSMACGSEVDGASDVGVEPASEPLAQTAQAISRDEVLARAKLWIDAGIPYCQAPNGAYDSYCGKTCIWPGHYEWDAYRSDCSGYVSWAWGLPAPGKVVSGLANISNKIDGHDLKPGDALVSDGHVALFVGWVNGQSQMKIWHEGSCGRVAEERIWGVGYINGSTIGSWDTLTAYRYPGVVDDTPPKGSLDQVSCESISGWAQDPDVATAALDVHLYLGGPAGSPDAVKLSLLADQHRDDLCSAIGSCNHAFSLPTPRSLLDGQPHPVHAYGIGQKGGANAQLGKSPLSLLCPPQPLAPSAILRRVKSEASFELWKFSKFQDVAPLYDSGAKVDPTAGKEGPELPLRPEVVRADDGTSELWLLDSGVRRRIPGESARVAWRLGEPTSMAMSMLYQLPLGADLPSTPALVMGPGPAFFVIDEPFLPDASEPTPGSKTPPSQGTATPDSKASPTATALPTKGDGSSAETTPTMPPAQDSSEGCSFGGAAGRGQGGVPLSAVFGVSMLVRLAARRRARLASS